MLSREILENYFNKILWFSTSLGPTSGSRTSGNSWGPSTKTGVTSRRKKRGSCKNDSEAENERRAQPEAIGNCRQTLVRSDNFFSNFPAKCIYEDFINIYYDYTMFNLRNLHCIILFCIFCDITRGYRQLLIYLLC